MEYENYNLLRAHGYLSNETFVVPENYGFITFSKHGSSRKSKLNDLLLCILNKNLKRIQNNQYIRKEYIGTFINKIFICPIINNKFKNYLILKLSDNKLKELDKELDIPKDVYENLINGKNTLDELDLEKILAKPFELFDFIKDENTIGKKILNLDISAGDYFNLELIESFDYLLNNLTKEPLDDKMIEKLYLMIKYTTFYGPGSNMQNLTLNIVGFYDSCKDDSKKKYSNIKKSGLISFEYLKNSNFEDFKKEVPCKYGINKGDSSVIKDIFYFEKKDGKTYLKYIDIFSENLNGNSFKKRCDEFSRLHDNRLNYNYVKTVYYLYVLSNKLKINEDESILMWRINNTGFKPTGDTKRLIQKRKLDEIYDFIMEEVYKIICNSSFHIYSFYYQVFNESNNINNFIKSKILEKIQEIQDKFHSIEEVNSYDLSKPSHYFKLAKILRGITDEMELKYRDITKIKLNTLIENYSLVNTMSIQPGIYLIPSCRSGEVLEENLNGESFFIR